MNEPLLDAAFLRRLEALRRRLAGAARSGGPGEGRAPRRGAGAEFREHRPYVSGDDPRRVDWMAYARTGEPVIKLYQAEEDRIVRILVDGSASMRFGSPDKLAVARRLAAAVAYLALAGSERTQLFLGRQGASSSGIQASGPARRGRRAFADVCRDLTTMDADGPGDLSRSVETIVARSERPGVLLVTSDYFDPGPVTTALGRARAAGHDVILAQVLDPAELNPELDGDFSLEDAETGTKLDVTADGAALNAYETALFGLFDRLRQWARQHGAVYVRTTTDAELESVIQRILARSID